MRAVEREECLESVKSLENALQVFLHHQVFTTQEFKGFDMMVESIRVRVEKKYPSR